MSTPRVVTTMAAVLAGAALSLAPADHARAQRIDPGARDILSYRLTPDAIARLRQVMLALDAYRAPSPEAVRPDVAMVTVLAMTGPYGGSFKDSHVQETSGTLDRGHPDLADAVRRAGLTSREYVLAWITVLAAHPQVAARRAGRSLETGVAPENVAFVESHWADVDGLVRDLGQRVQQARGGR